MHYNQDNQVSTIPSENLGATPTGQARVDTEIRYDLLEVQEETIVQQPRVASSVEPIVCHQTHTRHVANTTPPLDITLRESYGTCGLNPMFVHTLAGRDGCPRSLHIRGSQRELRWLCGV